MKTLSVPPAPGGPPLHALTGSLGKLLNPSVMRGSALWKSGFGPPLEARYVGNGPRDSAAPGAAGVDCGAEGYEHASSSSATALLVVRPINPRRLRSTA